MAEKEIKYPQRSVIAKGKQYRVVKLQFKDFADFRLEQQVEDQMGDFGWLSPATTLDFNSILKDLYGK